MVLAMAELGLAIQLGSAANTTTRAGGVRGACCVRCACRASPVWPSMEMRLSSYRQMSLPRPQWPAREAASAEMPSMLQPSPMMA